jgi:hypothetical protein
VPGGCTCCPEAAIEITTCVLAGEVQACGCKSRARPAIGSAPHRRHEALRALYHWASPRVSTRKRAKTIDFRTVAEIPAYL